jgi:hypothetical protein
MYRTNVLGFFSNELILFSDNRKNVKKNAVICIRSEESIVINNFDEKMLRF